MSYGIDGAFACPSCGALVTAWRGDPRSGRLFEADHIDPYLPHQCRPETGQLRRIVDLLELALIEAERHGHGPWSADFPALASAAVTATRPEGARGGPPPARQTAPSPPAAGAVAFPRAGETGQRSPSGRTVDA